MIHNSVHCGSADLRVVPSTGKRLLLNAEPFGFGPAAAIAAFASHLRPRCSVLGYAGVGHTLDLQRGLPYDSVHDLTAKPLDEWRAVLSGYDAVLTALDNEVAILAVDAGLRVAIYDPLAWYFAEIRAVAKRTLYLAQDFFGVAERYLERHASCHQL